MADSTNVKKNIPSAHRRRLESLILMFCITVVGCLCFVMFFVYDPSYNSLRALASVCMDIISIIIILILVLSATFERGGINKTSKLFLGLMLGTIFALFFDFLNWALDGSLAYGGWTFVFTVLSLCSGSILAGIFVNYLACYLDDMYDMKAQYLSAKICTVCNLVSFVVTIVLALTGTAFTFVDGHYELGALYDIVTVIPLLSLFYMTIYTVRHRKVIGFFDAAAVVTYICTMIIGTIIEAIYGIGTSYVSLAVADVIIFVTLQHKFLDRVKQQKDMLAERVDEEKRNVETWMRISNTDELTVLLNRHAYENEVALLEKDSVKNNFVYVSVDVNGLKTTNDSLGHEAGDEIIIGASKCLKQCLGAYGKLFRTGGDEFVALIFAGETELVSIKKDLEEVTKAWKGKFVESLSISCGYVCKKEAPDMTMHEMAVLADKRMYEDKARYYHQKGIDRRGMFS